ncbi:FkbM family methyltransferase [Endothiovibrio diazotrophicus]
MLARQADDGTVAVSGGLPAAFGVLPAVLPAQGEVGGKPVADSLEGMMAAVSARRFEPTAFAGDGVFVYGAGSRGRLMAECLERFGIKVLGWFDGDPAKAGCRIDDAPCRGPEALLEARGYPIVIASIHEWEIARRLTEAGIGDYFLGIVGHLWRDPRMLGWWSRELSQVYDWLEDGASKIVFAAAIKARGLGDDVYVRFSDYPQYRHPRVQAAEGDLIVEGGAYVADTTSMYCESVGKRCRIYAFEPSQENHRDLLAGIARDGLEEMVVPIKRGLWSSSATLGFRADFHERGAYRIADEGGTEEIEVEPLDRFVEREGIRVDLIKMDIEGAEVEALKGASETIRRFRPKLQISIYHCSEHYFEVAHLIKALVPSYRLFIGHHSPTIEETVLYAICD